MQKRDIPKSDIDAKASAQLQVTAMKRAPKAPEGPNLFDFDDGIHRPPAPFKRQLLKWIGNKQRFAHEIVSYFPREFGTYFEPFLGSGAVLATLKPRKGIASDVFSPLVQIWKTLHSDPDVLKQWYSERWHKAQREGKVAGYEEIKASYNSNPNGADLVFLCRACYGGVVRFRKADGYMSTPCGVHTPIPPDAFATRVDEWGRRTDRTEFFEMDYREAMNRASKGDLVYCDPPYKETQAILYGAQGFDLAQLFETISRCKSRGVFVVLSIDGTKKTGDRVCDIRIPEALFEREALVNCGRSMLRRFQMGGRTLEAEVVADRLLLSY
jgi:DNA adenine methylase